VFDVRTHVTFTVSDNTTAMTHLRITSKTRAFYEGNVEKCGIARQAADDNMALGTLRALYLRVHTHTRIFNSCCFSTVTLVTRTRLSVTLYVYYVSCDIDAEYTDNT
jgi:hypothetical protein